MGTDPGLGTANTGAHGSSQCNYGTSGRMVVVVNITPTQDKLVYDTIRTASVKAGLSVVDVDDDVDGVGDAAFEVDVHGSAGIYLRKGDALVVVCVALDPAASPPTDQVRALAKLVAGRI